MPELHSANHSSEADIRSYGRVPDAELTERIRAGAPTAYPATQELRGRHLPAVLAYARLCGENQVAGNQLAAQAFGLAAQEACRGIEPKGTWRHHLLMLVQRVAVTWASGARRVRLDSGFADWLHETADPRDGDPAQGRTAAQRTGVGQERSERQRLRLEDSSAMLAAFYGLPERTRGVLWYGVVEDESDTETARCLGVPAPVVAEQKGKALEAMRQAYLQAYLKRSGDPKCQGYRRIIEAAARPGDRRYSEDLTRHLEGCPGCTLILDELIRMTEHPRTVLAEGLLGWGGAEYIAAGPVTGLLAPAAAGEQPPAAEPGAPAATGTPDGPGGDGTADRRGPWWNSRPLVLVAAAVVVCAALGTALLVPDNDDGTPAGSGSHAAPKPPGKPSMSPLTPPPTASSTTRPPKKPAPEPTPTKTSARPSPTRTPSPSETAPTSPAPRPPEGYLQVVNASSGQCLDIEDGIMEDGTDAITAPCTGALTQMWRPENTGLFRSYADSDFCLDSRGDTDRGVGIWDCSDVEGDEGENLIFLIDRSGAIRPRIDLDFAITPTDESPGSEVVLRPAVGRDDQRWMGGRVVASRAD
ncbi:ricin-type beta-trefoil lectin domain protein [Streptomyces sp. NPDC047108]|uniref:ricin-type beta-trefoil lectin domain protein n=1 Tax=Streptomyces sp. NPDC047108 TaxID=3155025 RepID=UPI0033F13C9C